MVFIKDSQRFFTSKVFLSNAYHQKNISETSVSYKTKAFQKQQQIQSKSVSDSVIKY